MEKEVVATNFLDFCRSQFDSDDASSSHNTSGTEREESLYVVRQMHPLVLAYVGDAIYELFIRLCALRHETKVRHLHRMVTGLVKASTQAGILKSLEPSLTEEEQVAAKRGRNAKVGHTPKNAAMIDYRLATGFEALLGHLFFTRQDARLLEILTVAVNEGQRIVKSS